MTIAIVSLYANPLGQHHIDYINGAKQYGDVLAIVNNDIQVNLKGSYHFMNENERLKIVSSLKPVVYSRLSIDEDSTVVKTLERIVKDYYCSKLIFCNGGDRSEGSCSSVEEDFCRANGIQLAYNVGGGKTGSSSEILQNFINRYWLCANYKESCNLLAKAISVPLFKNYYDENNVLQETIDVEGWYSGPSVPLKDIKNE